MASPRIIDSVAKSNSIASWGERVWRWAGLVGIPAWLQLTAMPAVIAAWAYMSHLIGPWLWLIGIPLGLWTVTQAFKVYAAFQLARVAQSTKRVDLSQIASECNLFSKELLDYVAHRVVNHPSPSDWDTNMNYGNLTRARIVQDFAPRALMISTLLQSVGIEPLDLWSFDNNAASVATRVGAIGRLLERGLLIDARSMDPKRRPHSTIHLN